MRRDRRTNTNVMSNEDHVTAIIMAAGLSSRMGEIKQLITINGLSLLDRSIQAALEAGINRPIVILGHKASEITAAASLLCHCHIIFNESYRAGLSTSLICGVKEAAAETTAFLFMHADQPLIDGTLLRKMIAEYKKTGADILYPTYLEQRGNPVIVSSQLRSRLLTAKGDSGARFLFRDGNLNIRAYPVPNAAVITDVDTHEDLQKIRGLNIS